MKQFQSLNGCTRKFLRVTRKNLRKIRRFLRIRTLVERPFNDLAPGRTLHYLRFMRGESRFAGFNKAWGSPSGRPKVLLSAHPTAEGRADTRCRRRFAFPAALFV